ETACCPLVPRAGILRSLDYRLTPGSGRPLRSYLHTIFCPVRLDINLNFNDFSHFTSVIGRQSGSAEQDRGPARRALHDGDNSSQVPWGRRCGSASCREHLSDRFQQHILVDRLEEEIRDADAYDLHHEIETLFRGQHADLEVLEAFVAAQQLEEIG